MSVLDIAMAVVDLGASLAPRRMPSREQLERCRLISHRGEHDNKSVQENTLAAFRCARDAGVWGIECDIRWTADLVPVICHDASPARVFNIDTPLSELSFDQLRQLAPDIPSLREVIAEFGGTTHLMLELKAEEWPARERQSASLEEHLSRLIPADDYHLLALDPANYALAEFAPAHCYLPVAEMNVADISAYALSSGCAGIAGHYLLLGEHLRREHGRIGQRLGVGFPTSANALRRELNRGIEWIFSNDAVKLQRLLDSYLSRSIPPH